MTASILGTRASDRGSRLFPRAAGRHVGMVTRVLLVWSVATTWCLVGAQPAGAHATLVATTPRASAVLTAPPQQVLLEFTEPLERSSVARVRDPEGLEHPSALLFSMSGEVLVVLPEPGGPDGTWSVDYRAISADGHALTGTLEYSVGRLTGSDAARPLATPGEFVASLVLIATLGFGVTVRTMSGAGSRGET